MTLPTTRLSLIIPALVALLVSGLAGSSYAKDGERLPNFKQLCVVDKSTGFYWRNGAWLNTKFKTDKYIVSKITPPLNREEALKKKDVEERKAFVYCRQYMTKPEHEEGDFRYFNACLKIQEVGSKYRDHKICSEFHSKLKEENNWSIHFNCEGFNFSPNGNFHMATIHDQLEDKPKNGYKDSLSISVGKCVDISN